MSQVRAATASAIRVAAARQTVSVEAQADGFVFEDRIYSSLSAIACAWSAVSMENSGTRRIRSRFDSIDIESSPRLLGRSAPVAG